MLGKLFMAVLSIVLALVLLRHFSARTMQPKVGAKKRPETPKTSSDGDPVTLQKDPVTGVYKSDAE